MKKGTVSYILKLGLTLFLITAVVAGLLGLVNYITKDKIEAINVEKTGRAKAAVLKADSYEAVADYTDPSGLVTGLWKADDKGYVAECVVSGSQGNIDLMAGVDTEGKCTGISIVSHSETAGLGAVAAENSDKGNAFRSQFEGAEAPVAVTKDGGQIDAISGATISSRAIANAVTAAIAAAESAREGDVK